MFSSCICICIIIHTLTHGVKVWWVLILLEHVVSFPNSMSCLYINFGFSENGYNRDSNNSVSENYYRQNWRRLIFKTTFHIRSTTKWHSKLMKRKKMATWTYIVLAKMEISLNKKHNKVSHIPEEERLRNIKTVEKPKHKLNEFHFPTLYIYIWVSMSKRASQWPTMLAAFFYFLIPYFLKFFLPLFTLQYLHLSTKYIPTRY